MHGMTNRFMTPVKGDYTSEAEIREKVGEILKLGTKRNTKAALKEVGLNPDEYKAVKLSEDDRAVVIEKWITSLIENARRKNFLMTDIQLDDHRKGLKMARGTRVKYIGPDRLEKMSSTLEVQRKTGQVCVVTQVEDGKTGRLITAHPIDPTETTDGMDRGRVDLVVLEHTPGWLQLERIPDAGESR